MTTLRAKLIALIVVAIMVVVGLATWLSYLLLEQPSFEQIADANAAQIGYVLGMRNGSLSLPEDRIEKGTGILLGFRQAPAEGTALDHDELQAALRRYGLPSDVTITQQADARWPIASLHVPGSGWLIVPVAMLPPPPDLSPSLIGWILLVTIGVTGVAVMTVHKLTFPLMLIEKAVANVGPHGEFPVLPEDGSAEVRATAHAINKLSLRLKNAMKSRMRLVAAAGHDIRTPITRMRLRAEFLVDTDKDKWLNDLNELDRIADSAISLVREETADETGEEVQLDKLLEDVVFDLQGQQFDIRLMVRESAIVRAGPLALKRAFRNLMINAATHGGGGHINMSVCGDMAIVQICDNGPGIPDDMLERALEPFFRVEPSRSTRSGAGLGLAIAREIIERKGGSLSLSNGTSGGLLQTVQLPLAAGFPTQQPPRAA